VALLGLAGVRRFGDTIDAKVDGQADRVATLTSAPGGLPHETESAAALTDGPSALHDATGAPRTLASRARALAGSLPDPLTGAVARKVAPPPPPETTGDDVAQQRTATPAPEPQLPDWIDDAQTSTDPALAAFGAAAATALRDAWANDDGTSGWVKAEGSTYYAGTAWPHGSDAPDIARTFCVPVALAVDAYLDGGPYTAPLSPIEVQGTSAAMVEGEGDTIDIAGLPYQVHRYDPTSDDADAVPDEPFLVAARNLRTATGHVAAVVPVSMPGGETHYLLVESNAGATEGAWRSGTYVRVFADIDAIMTYMNSDGSQVRNTRETDEPNLYIAVRVPDDS
jgi:hypothetical protein